MTTKYSRLLTEQDINKVRDKFNEDIDFILEESIRKHVTIILLNKISIIFKLLQSLGGFTYY